MAAVVAGAEAAADVVVVVVVAVDWRVAIVVDTVSLLRKP